MHSIEDVLARDMCIGCGACAQATSNRAQVVFDPRGLFRADLSGLERDEVETASAVCPFSDHAADESTLAAERFGHSLGEEHPIVGYALRGWAGRRARDEELVGSSSGGLTSWLVEQLLDQRLVDAAVHVTPRTEGGALADYELSVAGAEVESGRKSQYYAVTLDAAILQIRASKAESFVVVGVPCFIRAIRLVARRDPVIARKVRWCIGLVCGHMKTRLYAESLAWQVGVEPASVSHVDFRVKVEGRAASDYDFLAVSRTGATGRRRSAQLVGTTWAHTSFQPGACDFCDDIFAETADVVFGDAWLPQYVGDSRGTNVIVTRDATLDSVLQAGRDAGEITLEPLSIAEVRSSQSGAIRHRVDGLAVRLHDDAAAGLSVPRKRTMPSVTHVTPKRLAVIRYRRSLAPLSVSAFLDAKRTGELEPYLRTMRRAYRKYSRLSLTRSQRARALVGRAKRAVRARIARA